MFFNYLKIAFRTLFKNKLHAFINIFGLSVAIAVAILGYVNYQFSQSYDAFHEHGDQIFGVHSNRTIDGQHSIWAQLPVPMGPALKADIFGIQAFTRLENRFGTLKYQDRVFNERFSFVDPDYLEMFSFNMISGETDALNQHNGLIISQRVAEKFFGDEDPVGKEMSVSMNNREWFHLVVRGIIQDAPANTAMPYSVLLPFNRQVDVRQKNLTSWKTHTSACLIQLRPDAIREQIEAQLQPFCIQTNQPNPDYQVDSFYLEPVHRLAQIEDDISGWEPYHGGMHPAAIITPSIIALFVLLLACFNFVNISISSAARRLNEIGVRKAIGALRGQLVWQFIGENLLMCVLALGLGLLLGDVFVSAYDRLWPTISLVLNFQKDITFILFLCGLLVFTALLAGLYPAFYISRFSPVGILKGKQKLLSNSKPIKVLISIQFFLAMINLMAAIALMRNTHYFKTMDPGFRIENIIQVPVNNASEYRIFKQAVQNHPQILEIAGTRSNLGSAPHFMDAEIGHSKAQVWRFRVGADYLETMGVKLIQGSYFNPDLQFGHETLILVNQNFCDHFALNNPVGTQIALLPDNDRHVYHISGVVSDFHIRDIDSPVEPAVFAYVPETQYTSMAIHFKKENAQSVMAYLRETWAALFSDFPFNGYHLVGIRQNEIEITTAIATVFLYIGLITLVIIAMGLFALIALNIEKRTKEIAVRQILGGSVLHVSKLLIRDFILAFVISIVLSAGLGTFLLSMLMGSIWDEYYGLDALPVILSGLVMIIVAVFAVGIQMRRITGRNPVESLRYE